MSSLAGMSIGWLSTKAVFVMPDLLAFLGIPSVSTIDSRKRDEFPHRTGAHLTPVLRMRMHPPAPVSRASGGPGVPRPEHDKAPLGGCCQGIPRQRGAGCGPAPSLKH